MKSNWLWVFRQKHNKSEIPKMLFLSTHLSKGFFFHLVPNFNLSHKVSVVELTPLWEESIAKTLMFILVSEFWFSELFESICFFLPWRSQSETSNLNNHVKVVKTQMFLPQISNGPAFDKFASDTNSFRLSNS